MSTLLTVGTVWMLVSFVAGIVVALVGRRIFRKPPAPPRLVDGEEGDAVLIQHREFRPVTRIYRDPKAGA